LFFLFCIVFALTLGFMVWLEFFQSLRVWKFLMELVSSWFYQNWTSKSVSWRYDVYNYELLF
jgi:hypothetical protein